MENRDPHGKPLPPCGNLAPILGPGRTGLVPCTHECIIGQFAADLTKNFLRRHEIAFIAVRSRDPGVLTARLTP